MNHSLVFFLDSIGQTVALSAMGFVVGWLIAKVNKLEKRVEKLELGE